MLPLPLMLTNSKEVIRLPITVVTKPIYAQGSKSEAGVCTQIEYLTKPLALPPPVALTLALSLILALALILNTCLKSQTLSPRSCLVIQCIAHAAALSCNHSHAPQSGGRCEDSRGGADGHNDEKSRVRIRDVQGHGWGVGVGVGPCRDMGCRGRGRAVAGV